MSNGVSDFKNGDIVSLKSGGPAMTVEVDDDDDDDDRSKVTCVWFDSTGSLQRDLFFKYSLHHLLTKA